MDKFKKIGSAIVCSMLTVFLYAQNTETNEPADFMRSDGKIYVVVAVIVTIITGIFFYLLNLDRKIKKLERGLKNNIK